MFKSIDRLLAMKQYMKAITETINLSDTVEKDKFINWIIYKEVLIYKDADKKYYEEYVRPTCEKLVKTVPELKEYIYEIGIINETLRKNYNSLEENFKLYKRYNVQFVVYHICCIYEKYIHDLRNIVINNTMSPDSIYGNEQDDLDKAINGFNWILKRLYKQRDQFPKRRQHSDIRFDEKNIERESKNNIIRIISEIISAEELLEMIKGAEGHIDSFDRGVYKIRYSKDALIKYNLAKFRQRNFDNIMMKSYTEGLANKFKKIQIDDINKFIDIDVDRGNFRIPIDTVSEEFLDNIGITMSNFLGYLKFIMYDNYIEEAQIQQYVEIKGHQMKYTFLDLIYFYAVISAVSEYYFLAEEAFGELQKKHSNTPIIVMNKASLEQIVKSIYTHCLKKDSSDEVISKMIDFYTYGSNNIFDTFCTPLIKIKEIYYILPSTLRFNNFGRVFIHHMNKLGIELKKGYIFEENFKLMLKEHNFNVYNPKKPQLNFKTKKGHQGDIDVLAIKGDYIFCVQLKNKSMPLEKQEFINYDRKLPKAIRQLEYAEEFLKENPRKILDFYRIDDLRRFKIVSFVVVNGFYRSGECCNGIYITDISALNVLFDKGKITMQQSGEKVIKSLRKGDQVTPEELEEFLKRPYFLWKGVYIMF